MDIEELVLELFFHNSRLIRLIQQNKIYKRIQRLDHELNPDACLTVSHLTITLECFLCLWGYN